MLTMADTLYDNRDGTVKLSIIVGTRNRADRILSCLDSIAVAIQQAPAAGVEIVVVDNGSSDNTPRLISSWARSSSVPVQCLQEPQPGVARAHNRALRAARGALFAFTDDDCRVDAQYVDDLLRHDSGDRGLVLRGGRVELGDASDLPLTINTSLIALRWTRAMNSARHSRIGGCLNGCNLAMRRALVDRIGGFDERFGPGSYIGSGADTEFIYRSYLAGAILEYVPDMVVFHHHGRRTRAAGHQLMRRYAIANGALFIHYGLRHRDLCRIFYGDLREAALGILRRKDTQSPPGLFTNKDLLVYAALGAIKYILIAKKLPFRLDETHLPAVQPSLPQVNLHQLE
jgi:glycosyltransferase involved in cell wall biosynthesis